MGGGKIRYHSARKLLDGAAAHRAAFESLIDSFAAGEENTVSLLMEIDEVLPVVSESPDWPAVWSLLAEQMMFTREYQLGKLSVFQRCASAQDRVGVRIARVYA